MAVWALARSSVSLEPQTKLLLLLRRPSIFTCSFHSFFFFLLLPKSQTQTLILMSFRMARTHFTHVYVWDNSSYSLNFFFTRTNPVSSKSLCTHTVHSIQEQTACPVTRLSQELLYVSPVKGQNCVWTTIIVFLIGSSEEYIFFFFLPFLATCLSSKQNERKKLERIVWYFGFMRGLLFYFVIAR